jgi:hypothetical protein
MENFDKKSLISETTALQIVSVIAWLWVVPVIDSLDSYSYGMATRALITSFLPFVLGVITSVHFPNFATPKIGKLAIITGCIVLIFTLVFYVQIFHYINWWFLRHWALLRFVGFALLGYGMKTLKVLSKPISFAKGILILVIQYIVYNLLLWGSHNAHPDYMLLYNLSHILLALVRIAIIVTLWKTLSADSVTWFCAKSPKISAAIAGLFWGMILVLPADNYSPRWLAVVMLLVAPIIAYIMTVIVRISVQLVMYVVKGILDNKFWWLESCCWWINKIENNEGETA